MLMLEIGSSIAIFLEGNPSFWVPFPVPDAHSHTGTYWRIMDSLVVEKSQELQKRMMNTEREEKKHLS